ncbi:MAG TPA: S41 family peptidase, partial [Syntrophomonas sp.]|nr:S41 family peptidase [Syntrophomonas sp.]
NVGGLSTFFSVLGLVKTQSLYDIDDAKAFEGAASGIVSLLNDPYSEYLDKNTWQELQIRLDAKFGGIGVYILQDGQGRLKILSPIKGTPAYKEGVKHGDIITKINGESAVGMSQDEAVHLMRGDPGTQLLLSVYRGSDGKEHDFRIIREIINVPSVEARVIDSANQIGYISLNQFGSRSAEEMKESMNDLLDNKKVRGLILDLRNNGGGDFDVSIAIAGIFLDGDKVVSAVDAHGNEKVYSASKGKVDIPLVVLVNEDSASASEILAAALRDNQRAVLVGKKTFGKGLVQTVFPLRNGGALKLTTQKYYTPAGIDINEVGITPDYVVENNADEDTDLQLDKAISVLKKQIY